MSNQKTNASQKIYAEEEDGTNFIGE